MQKLAELVKREPTVTGSNLSQQDNGRNWDSRDFLSKISSIFNFCSLRATK